MNGVGFPVTRVLEGIAAASAAGLKVKVNAVVKRGVNDTRSSSSHGISAAPATSCGSSSTWTSGRRTGGAWTMSSRPPRSWHLIDRELPLEPAEENYRGEVARRWRYRDGGGEIGVIASVTQPFCGDCSGSRISAEGRLYTCLFATTGFDLRALVRSGATESELAAAVGKVWRKPVGPLFGDPLLADQAHRARRDVVHRRLGVATTHCAGTDDPPGLRREGPSPVGSTPTPSPSARSRSWSGPRRS